MKQYILLLWPYVQMCVCVCVCVCKQAKDMITLVNKFAAKLEDKKGALTEDEVSSLVYTEPEQLHV